MRRSQRLRRQSCKTFVNGSIAHLEAGSRAYIVINVTQVQDFGEVFSAREGFVGANGARDNELGAVPGAVSFELGRTADDAAVDHFHVWSGGGEVLVCFSRRAWTHGVQVEKVQRIVALLELGTCSSGDYAVCDGLCVSLRGDGEYVVGLVT